VTYKWNLSSHLWLFQLRGGISRKLKLQQTVTISKWNKAFPYRMSVEIYRFDEHIFKYMFTWHYMFKIYILKNKIKGGGLFPSSQDSTNGGLLLIRYWTFGSYKRRRISPLTYKLLASQEGLNSMELDLKGFWRWCMLYRTIWPFLDSVHRLVCGSFTKDHNVSETGSVSFLRWMGQDRPTQLGPSERVSLNHWS
jgi:hypothetical protein